jgi:hypothetical protein
MCWVLKGKEWPETGNKDSSALAYLRQTNYVVATFQLFHFLDLEKSK